MSGLGNGRQLGHDCPLGTRLIVVLTGFLLRDLFKSLGWRIYLG